ncbi:acyl-malonyl condensing enzyme-related [Anaeramoeba flamelloides]|uniref:Acyl-malonyl condensing enzyme-related n=1 Tax=Anaeramoeba flamelloides TaxID=1746091 RepID=A0AAV8A4E6_9EUKA|nr:acyl-malonyl condensing enzyme-related [Anaeramoeba flamelloides]
MTQQTIGKRWLFFSFFSLIFTSLETFFLSYTTEKLGTSSDFSTAMMLLIMIGLIGLILIIYLCVKKVSVKENIKDKKNLAIAIFGGISFSLSVISLELGLSYDRKGKGPILAFNSFTSPIIAIVCYFWLKESVSLPEMFAILCSILGASMSVVGYSGVPHSFMFGFLTLICLTISNLCLKYLVEKEIKKILIMALICFVSFPFSIFGLLVSIGSAKDHNPFYGLDGAGYTFLAILASFCSLLALYTFLISLTCYKAGPVSSFAFSSVLLVTIFDKIFLKIDINMYKIFGIFVTIVGISVLVFENWRTDRAIRLKNRNPRLNLELADRGSSLDDEEEDKHLKKKKKKDSNEESNPDGVPLLSHSSDEKLNIENPEKLNINTQNVSLKNEKNLSSDKGVVNENFIEAEQSENSQSEKNEKDDENESENEDEDEDEDKDESEDEDENEKK